MLHVTTSNLDCLDTRAINQIKNMSMKGKQAILSVKDKQIIISHLDRMNDGLHNAIKLQVFEANKHGWTF